MPSAKLGDVQHRIANAENERQRILVEARQTAEALKAQIVARAERGCHQASSPGP